ncbi:hypothetical protein [Tanticharoenia sakaeratensis]|uniref:Uncharacterized protein n=1 Tax=Tanticharoenia sakaeratensis NBRC 103193 TaxID=1231623 RepID=A0A0D6MND8_9PROT|nr:hypothetical protein [Tanticharoenia sakaeratensis]GAN55212.1 hypothetical protein Tasa_041_007 [Tanticharoenia sakaeratensis NBRC 103193]GBQ23253.1 hypothetical protein AA103193_2350 [Tanticharoenia sakaeratensis NBRC 103193]
MTEHRWPPQPGDLVKVADELFHSACPEASLMVGECFYVQEVIEGEECLVRINDWLFHPSDLSPATLPETIEHLGRTYRLDEGGRTDAERLGWMRKHTTVSLSFSLRHRWGVFQRPDDLLGCGETPSAAIDAAISATAEPTP